LRHTNPNPNPNPETNKKKFWRFSLFIELINFCQIFRWMEAKDYPVKNETLPD
jgi:hypothetical protein